MPRSRQLSASILRGARHTAPILRSKVRLTNRGKQPVRVTICPLSGSCFTCREERIKKPTPQFNNCQYVGALLASCHEGRPAPPSGLQPFHASSEIRSEVERLIFIAAAVQRYSGLLAVGSKIGSPFLGRSSSRYFERGLPLTSLPGRNSTSHFLRSWASPSRQRSIERPARGHRQSRRAKFWRTRSTSHS